MTTIITLTISSLLFGFYDMLLKLSAGKLPPLTNSLLVQLSSVATILIVILVRLIAGQKELSLTSLLTKNLSLSITAGITISLALICLTYSLTQIQVKVSTIMSAVIIGRNLSLILLSVIFLKESLSPNQILGLVLGFAGLFFLINN